MLRKGLALLTVVLLCMSMAACAAPTATPQGTTGSTTTTTTASGGSVNISNISYPDNAPGYQLNRPKNGETIVILHTSMGDISIRLFPEAAPKAVENFITHAKNGYYDGLTFHRVIADFMIQGGDPDGDGSGGESIWGTPFEDEFNSNLLNLRGSLAMANSGVNTNGSQFFINQGDADTFNSTYTTLEDYAEQCEQTQASIKAQYNDFIAQYGKAYVEQYFGSLETVLASYCPNVAPSQEVWDLYKQYGGSLHLDGAFRTSGGHTVFGQVYDGMNVVDAIAAVTVDATNNKPVTAVVINSVEVTTYSSGGLVIQQDQEVILDDSE